MGCSPDGEDAIVRPGEGESRVASSDGRRGGLATWARRPCHDRGKSPFHVQASPPTTGRCARQNFEVTSAAARRTLRGSVALFAFYAVVVTLGILSMGFQLLASRLLNPHFGSSIIVWAWLISTFLSAFSVGSMVGGWISNLAPAARRRGQRVGAALAVLTLAITAVFGRTLLGQIEVAFPEVSTALLVSCFGIFFVPVTALSTFGPQCVQYLATRGMASGKASGIVYGVSTLGNIAGVMLTAFALIPNLPVSTLLYLWLAVAVVSLAALLRFLSPTAP